MGRLLLASDYLRKVVQEWNSCLAWRASGACTQSAYTVQLCAPCYWTPSIQNNQTQVIRVKTWDRFEAAHACSTDAGRYTLQDEGQVSLTAGDSAGFALNMNNMQSSSSCPCLQPIVLQNTDLTEHLSSTLAFLSPKVVIIIKWENSCVIPLFWGYIISVFQSYIHYATSPD